MRSALCLALALWSAPALALTDADAERQVHLYIHAQQECRIGETFTGIALTSEQSDKACAVRDALIEQLKSGGFCFDDSEQEWSKCGTGMPVPTPRP